MATGPIVAASVATGVAVSKLIKRKQQEEKIPVYNALRNQVYSVLFPGDGIPLNHTTYICNPIDTRRYYLVEGFHREMMNHKVYEPNEKPPFIPDDVFWIDQEPQWLHIANERLHNGLTSFELAVDVSNDFGVTFELAAILKGESDSINGNINGKYNKFKKSSMILSGKFSRYQI